MDNKGLWNDIAKGGLLLGLVMSASKILEMVAMVVGSTQAYVLMGIEWIIAALLFCVLLFYIVKKRSLKSIKELGFSYFNAWSYAILISVFASIWVSLSSYCVMNFVFGYENYVESIIGSMTAILESNKDMVTSDIVDLYHASIDAMREVKQPGIIDSVIGSAYIYTISGTIAGAVIAAITQRKPEIFDNTNADKSDE